MIYPNAPIKEAIIDIRVGGVPDAVASEFAALETEVGYKVKRKMTLGHGEIKVSQDSEPEATATQKHVGFAFISHDSLYIFQARINGFTFSRLSPYESWEPFRDEAKRCWSLYRTLASTAKLDRIALRYVNRFDIPADPIELKEYFQTYPEWPAELATTLEGFFMRLKIPHGDINCQSIVTQTVVPPEKPDMTAVVLDIDLFRSEDVPSEDSSVWGAFEAMRVRKDEIFEACITEDARRLIR